MRVARLIKWSLATLLVGSVGWNVFRPLADNGTDLGKKLRDCGSVNVRNLYGEDVVAIAFLGRDAVLSATFGEECRKQVSSNSLWSRESIVVSTAEGNCRVFEYMGEPLSQGYAQRSFDVVHASTIALDETDQYGLRVKVSEATSDTKCSSN